MNGEGSQSDRDKPVEVDDNVIRLTDWLGPREELVPFGPAADSEQARSAGRDATDPVPAADDFWSESSAAVQDALMAPYADPRHASAATRRAPRSRASAAAVWGRRRASLLAPATGRTNEGNRPRELSGRALAVTLVVGLVAALVVSGVETQGKSSPARLGGHGATARVDLTTHSRIVASASRSLGRRATARLPSRARTFHPSGSRRAGGQNNARHRATGPAVSSQPVGYTTPAPVPEPSTATQTTPVSNPTHAATSSTPAATRAAASGSGSGSQPTLGANGSLAPGSSPDG
jgi:hypothetical protein